MKVAFVDRLAAPKGNLHLQDGFPVLSGLGDVSEINYCLFLHVNVSHSFAASVHEQNTVCFAKMYIVTPLL